MSRWSIRLHLNDMEEPAQPLDVNTLHNVHVIEERKLLPMGRRSYLELFSWIFSRLLHQCLIISMPLFHKEPRAGWAPCRALVLLCKRTLESYASSMAMFTLLYQINVAMRTIYWKLDQFSWENHSSAMRSLSSGWMSTWKNKSFTIYSEKVTV